MPKIKILPSHTCLTCLMTQANPQHLASCPDDCGAHDYVDSYGLVLTIDGHAVKDLCDFSLHFPVDGAAELHAKVLINEGFTFEGSADTHLHVHLSEGTRLIDVTNQDSEGRTHQVIKIQES
jgi:hypothetical protein